MNNIEQRRVHPDAPATVSSACHNLSNERHTMTHVNPSLPKRGRTEVILSVVFAIGILVATILPAPHHWGASESHEQYLFTLVESDYLNPLFSSPSAIHLLNGAAKQVAQLAGYDEFQNRFDTSEGLSVASITRYTGDLFSILNVSFAVRDNPPLDHPYVYISDTYWARAFARASNIIGTALKIHGTVYTIAGVTASFQGLLAETDIWVPIRSRSALAGMNSMKIIGAVREDHSWDDAERELTAIVAEHFGEDAYIESPGARLLPLVNPIRFSAGMPIVASAKRKPASMSQKSTPLYQPSAFPSRRGS